MAYFQFEIQTSMKFLLLLSLIIFSVPSAVRSEEYEVEIGVKKYDGGNVILMQSATLWGKYYPKEAVLPIELVLVKEYGQKFGWADVQYVKDEGKLKIRHEGAEDFVVKDIWSLVAGLAKGDKRWRMPNIAPNEGHIFEVWFDGHVMVSLWQQLPGPGAVAHHRNGASPRHGHQQKGMAIKGGERGRIEIARYHLTEHGLGLFRWDEETKEKRSFIVDVHTLEEVREGESAKLRGPYSRQPFHPPLITKNLTKDELKRIAVDALEGREYEWFTANCLHFLHRFIFSIIPSNKYKLRLMQTNKGWPKNLLDLERETDQKLGITNWRFIKGHMLGRQF